MLRRRWIILAVLFTARMAMALQFQTIGSSGPLLVDGLSFTYSDIGTLIGLYLLPGVVIAFPGGMLGQRFGATVVLGGLLLMAIGGGVTGAGATVGVISLGRLISGTGAVLLNVLLAKMVADWFTDRSLTTAMGILVTSWPLGVGVGLVGGQAVATAFGWPALMYLGAGIALACLVLVWAVYRDPPEAPAAGSVTLNGRLNAYELRMALIAGAIWAAYNVGFIVLISFAPEFFVARGYTLAQGSWIVSLLGWFLVPMIVLGGYLTGRVGRPNLFMAAGFIVAALAAAALPITASPVILFIVIAIAAGLPAGPIMALPIEALRPESRAAGMGVYFTCYYAGMAMLPALAGAMRDRFANATAPVLFASAMMICSLGLLGAFRAAERKPFSSEMGSGSRQENA
jgi:predicted MFS family arabinose efflux permease